MNEIVPIIFMVVVMLTATVLGPKFAVENRNKELISAWCRSEQTELAAYENCVKNSKPKWWPEEGK